MLQLLCKITYTCFLVGVILLPGLNRPLHLRFHRTLGSLSRSSRWSCLLCDSKRQGRPFLKLWQLNVFLFHSISWASVLEVIFNFFFSFISHPFHTQQPFSYPSPLLISLFYTSPYHIMHKLFIGFFFYNSFHLTFLLIAWCLTHTRYNM